MFADLSKATRQRTYEYGWRLIERWSAANGHPDARTLTRSIVQDFYEAITAADPDTGERKLAKGKNMVAALRVLLKYAGAKLEGMPATNPAHELLMASRKPRHRIWEDAEFDKYKYCETARQMGRPAMVLAAHIARALGPRREDIVNMTAGHWTGNAFRFHQSKTGELVHVPATARLRPQVLAWIAARKLEPGDRLLADDETGAPYTGDSFWRGFQEIVKATGLTDLWFHDLHRTCVVRLARAGLNEIEIASITGHEPRSVDEILRYYLKRDSEVAANAIRKLDEYEAARQDGVQSEGSESSAQ